MPDAELERMIVRLDGDARNYMRMLSDAQKGAQDTAASVAQSASRIEAATSAVTGYAASAASALAALGLGALLRDAFGNFAEAEGIGLRLNAVLDANGRAVATLTEEYRQFAEALEETTTQEDDAVLAMLTMAETFDTTGGAAQEAVRNAVALSAVAGGAAENYIRLTSALARGDVEQAMRFARMVPQLRGIKDQAEFAEKAAKLFESGMRAAEAQAGSMSGTLARLRRDFGNMLEDVGAFIAEGLKPLVEAGSDLVKWFRGLDDGMKRNVTIMASVVTGFLALGPALRLIGLLGVNVFNPLILVVGAVGFAVSVFVERSGGIGPAIANAREAVTKFVDDNRDMIRTLAIAAGTVAGLVLAFKVLQATHVTTAAAWALHMTWVVVSTTVITVFKVAVTVLTAALGLLSLALTPLGALFAVALVPAMVAAGVAAVALFNTFRDLAGVLSGGFSASGFGQVLDMFREWGGIVVDVGRAMTVSFDLAWRMVVAGGRLAIAQIRDLWTPLWTLIQGGFSEVWHYVSEMFFENMYAAYARFHEYVRSLATGAVDAGEMDRIDRRLRQAADTHGRALANNLAVYLGRFRVDESQATRDARAALTPLRNELNDLMNQVKDDPLREAGDAAGSAFSAATDKIKETKDAVSELKAAAVGSVDAAAQLAKYLAGTVEQRGGPAGRRVPGWAAEVGPEFAPRAVAGIASAAQAVASPAGQEAIGRGALAATSPVALFQEMVGLLRAIAEKEGVDLVETGEG